MRKKQEITCNWRATLFSTSAASSVGRLHSSSGNMLCSELHFATPQSSGLTITQLHASVTKRVHINRVDVRERSSSLDPAHSPSASNCSLPTLSMQFWRQRGASRLISFSTPFSAVVCSPAAGCSSPGAAPSRPSRSIKCAVCTARACWDPLHRLQVSTRASLACSHFSCASATSCQVHIRETHSPAQMRTQCDSGKTEGATASSPLVTHKNYLF